MLSPSVRIFKVAVSCSSSPWATTDSSKRAATPAEWTILMRSVANTSRTETIQTTVGAKEYCSDFLFPLQPPHPPYPDKPPGCPTPKSLISVHFGSVSAPFRVRFGVLGGVGVGSGRGASVRERISLEYCLINSLAWPCLQILVVKKYLILCGNSRWNILE